MSYSQLVQLYFERSTALQWYWTLYVIVIGGLLAFASQRQRPDRLTTVLVTVLYLFFANKNLSAIHEVTDQRFAVLHALRESATASPATSAPDEKLFADLKLSPPEYGGVRTFHVASDVLTVFALWAMERRRKRYAAEQVAKS